MDVTTLNFAMEKLNVYPSTAPASSQTSAEMTGSLSTPPFCTPAYENAEQAVSPTPALMPSPPKANQSSNCDPCSLAAGGDVMSSYGSALDIPPSSNTSFSPSSDHVDSENCNNSSSKGHILVFEHLSLPRPRPAPADPQNWETPLHEEEMDSSSNLIMMEHHSSEEELSQVDWSRCPSGQLRSSSFDEEVCQLLSNSMPSADRFCPVAAENGRSWLKNFQVPRMNGAIVAPRRKVYTISSSSSSSSSCDLSAVILRPNLDFDKMRKTSCGRRITRTDIKKPKIVRFRGFREPMKCIKNLQNRLCPSVSVFYSLAQKVGFDRVSSPLKKDKFLS